MRKMRKEKTMKKIVSAVMALLMTIALFVPTYADVQPEMRSQSPRLVMRETVGYEPSHITYKWEGTRVGAVSGDNRVGNSPMQLNFTYQTTSTVTATFDAEVEWESQQNYIIGAISQRASFDVTSSRSWVRGQSYGVVVAVDPGKRQMITGYIPWVRYTRMDIRIAIIMSIPRFPIVCFRRKTMFTLLKAI